MKPSLRLFATPAAILLFAVAVGLATDWLQQRAERQEMAENFAAMASRLAEQVAARMHTYEYGLRGLRGAVVAGGGTQITNRQVQDYSATRDIRREFRGAHGFGVVLRVPREDEGRFVAQARREGQPAFEIRRISPNDGEAAVIKYIEPLDANRKAVGLDIASEPRRHAAAVAALRDGTAELTAPLTLVQGVGRQLHGFLLLLPIYQPRLPLATPAQRDAAAIGWSYAALVSDEVLQGLDLYDGDLSLTLRDKDDPHGVPFFSSGQHTPDSDAPTRQLSIPVYGRTWIVDIQATPHFGARTDVAASWRLGGVAGGLAALLASAVAALARARRRERLAGREMARRAAIVESSEDAIVAETLEGIITEWNSGAERLFGYSAAEALGRTAAGLILPPHRAQEDAHMRAVTARGERLPAFDTTRLHRSGASIDVSITAAPIRDALGRCVGFAKTLRDIADTQAARRALSQLNDSLERQVVERTERLDVALRDLRTILDNVPSMIGYWDRALVNRVANRAYAQWFGTTPEALRGRLLGDVLGPGLDASLSSRIEDALAGVPQTFDRTIERPDGSTGHFLVHYMPDLLDGQAQGFYVLVHDVTELTRNQRALAAALRENGAILETLHRHALVSVADRGGRIVDVNESFCRVSGYSAEELRGQNHRIVNSGEHDAAFWRGMWRTIVGGSVWRGEVCNRAKDGTLYWVDSVIAPFLDADGRIEKYVSIRTDITLSKRLQQEAQEAQRRATLANNAKSQFLANMSHEIRTPLNAVIGLAYMLEKTPLAGDQIGFVSKIGLAGRTLLSLINDVLDLSKIEAAEMRLEEVAFSLRDAVADVAAMVDAQAQAKGVRFEAHLHDDVPDVLMGDPTRLRQVLLNLLGNAVKFTERGHVRLTVELDACKPAVGPAQRVALALRVADTGIGIAPHELERLFAPFAQADTSTTRRFGGTGLGLSIVKQLLELMGGAIEAVSEPGAGSEFTARVGFRPASPQAVALLRPAIAPEASARALDGLSLLVVDDSDLNLEVARRILEHLGARVWLARNGREAVDFLRAGDPAVDLVLMDVQMPVMHGHDATRLIRTELGLATLPVIALTAGMTTGERERAAEAGMDGVVGKPFEPEALVRVILEATRRTLPPGAEAPAAQAPDAAWPRIAGIDADDACRRMNGDVDLMHDLVARFLKDSDGIAALLAADAFLPGAVSARMHDLKGMAATIAARSVATLAGQVEAHCGVASGPVAPALASQLLAELAALRAACEAHVAAAAPRAGTGRDDVAIASEPVSDADVERLARQLEQGEFGAVASMRELAPGLRGRLGETRVRALREACDDLRFDDALEILQADAALPAA